MMSTNNKPTEDNVDELVKKWIEQNPAEFTIDGKPFKIDCKADSKRLRFRPRVLERCKEYKNAPDEYLKTMLKTFPESIKWWFGILQTLLVAGLIGFTTTISVFTLNNFLSWLPEPIFIPISPKLVSWIFPLIIIILPIFCLALKTNKETETSWLSYLIQYKSRIVHGLVELKIEIYYVSKIIEIREKEKEAEKKAKQQEISH